jgi:hypothetical protein
MERYIIHFTVVVDAFSEEEAVDEARQLVSRDDFEPDLIERED